MNARTSPVRVACWLIAIVIFLAIVAPYLAPYAPYEMGEMRALKSQAPSWAHPLGTDDLARDVLSRLLHGTRVSLGVAALAVVVALSIGTLVGITAALAGGLVETLLMRVTDAALAFPRTLALLLLVATIGPLPPQGFGILIGATGWMMSARLARAETLRLLATEYVRGARAVGVPWPRLVRRHLLPGLTPTLLAAATIAFAAAIPLEAGLSFLGLGVQPPDPSWGNIISQADSRIVRHWWMVLFPTLAIAITVMAANAVAERLKGDEAAP